MFAIKSITKSFGNLKAVDTVNIDLKKGVTALLGPNGAGKTTLMRIMSGFLSPNSGKMVWNKKIVDTDRSDYRKKIGYLPESNPLYGWMYPQEYLRFVANLKDVPIKDIKRVIEACGLTEMLGKKIEQLSKGYRQRVGLAATLLGKPELLILDEPSSGLDPNQIIEIRRLIKKLASNKIVLLSTHILPEAKEMADKIVIINRGKIVMDQANKGIRNLEKKFVELTA